MKHIKTCSIGTVGSYQANEEETFEPEEANALNKVVINSNSSQGQKPQLCSGEIEFREVSFAYPTRKENDILRGFSLIINCGKLVAIVGSR